MTRIATHASERGFTLVEMLVALAIFGIVSVVGVALASSALGATARSEVAIARIDSVERTRQALAADLGQAVPRISLSAEGRPLPAFTLTEEGFVLVRRGAHGLVPPVQKIAWGFDGQRLLRQTWPRVDGATPGPATVMMDGLGAVSLRVRDDEGWQASWTPDKADALPRALELTLVPRSGPPLVLKFLVAA
ncbi:MAG: type II secretion system protein GspJ [Thermaurantiacus sp.]